MKPKINKNIKKIFIYCLYSVITLSTSIVECCEKRTLASILNTSNEELPLPDIILSYFKFPVTNQQFGDDNNNEQININPINLNISNSDNNIKSITSAFSEVKKRKIESEKNLSNKIQKIENECIKINFSCIDTIKNYNAISKELPERKKTFVTVICDICGLETSGVFSSARYSMSTHRLLMHLTKSKLNNNNDDLTKSPAHEITEYITLDFSSIDTQKKYDNMALKFPARKGTLVIIKCNQPGCSAERKGLLRIAYSHMKQHINKIHLKKIIT